MFWIRAFFLNVAAVCSAFIVFTPCAMWAQSDSQSPTVAPPPYSLTSDQQQAVNNMTSDQVQSAQAAMQQGIQKLKSDIANHQAPTGSQNWQAIIAGTQSSGDNQQLNATPSLTFSSSTGTDSQQMNPSSTSGAQVTHPSDPQPCGQACVAKPHPIPLIVDNDQDGLPDSLEGEIADEFTPLYHVSSSEPNQFATFGDYVPMTVTSTVGSTPPFSYYRVQPLGLTRDTNGNSVFAVRVDYLTLWNADGGLVGGGVPCFYSYVGLNSLINAVSGHDLDAERSGMLLAAPSINGNYNPDPSAYKLYAIYTAAHEGTFFDQSSYIIPSNPVQSREHLILYLSLQNTVPIVIIQTIIPLRRLGLSQTISIPLQPYGQMAI